MSPISPVAAVMAFTTSFGNKNSGYQAGINNGEVHNHFYPPAQEQSETPPKPLSTVPFPRDTDFINREALFHQISEKCSAPASRVALCGLGGVGKSQLAIEYSYQRRDESDETWALWIHASSPPRFVQSCQEIADQLKIPGRKAPEADMFQVICNWLRDERSRNWILCLDNVDDVELLKKVPTASQDEPGSGQESTKKPLSAYLPPNPNGSIIVTTRNKKLASEIVESSGIIEVSKMDESDALALFEKKLEMEPDGEEAKAIGELVAALDFIPLAIVQAVAYIKGREGRCSVKQYLENFCKTDKALDLLDSEGGHLRRDWESKTSIWVTWQMSFDCIQQERPSAADLLSLMSFFDRQGIAEDLLLDRTEPIISPSHESPKEGDGDRMDYENEDNATESSMDDRFERDIMTLRNYMFISSNGDKKTFKMLGLVQLALQMWLESHGQLERWKGVFIRNVYSKFPTGKFKNWDKCQRLFPHAQSAVAQQPDKEVSLRYWARLLYNAGSYAMERGNIADARKMAEKAVEARNQLHDPKSEGTLNSIDLLGRVYSIGGKWKKAEALQVKVLRPKNPDTVTSMSNLAYIYKNQGKWKKAEELEVQVLETRKQVSEPKHPDNLTSINNLACTYLRQGKLGEAEELLEPAMEAFKQGAGAKSSLYSD